MLGLTSTGGVFKVLGWLVGAGYLERVGGRFASNEEVKALTLVGTVSTGLSQPADQVEDYELMNG